MDGQKWLLTEDILGVAAGTSRQRIAISAVSRVRKASTACTKVLSPVIKL